MKVFTSSLAGLALFSKLIEAQSAYGSVCNSPVAGEVEIQTGVFATYRCATWYDSSQYNGHQEASANPTTCATSCSKRSPEGPCSWYSGTCYFYNAGATTYPAVAPHDQAVSISIRKDWDTLQAALDTCLANAISTVAPTCSGTTGPQITEKNGLKYVLLCGQVVGGQSEYTAGSNIEDCLNQCHSRGCLTTTFDYPRGRCWFGYSNMNQVVTPANNDGHHAAIRMA